jgi:RHS repeat-associated protein
LLKNDNANRLTQIAQGTAIVGLAYDAANRQARVTLPNGIVETPTFDDANQLLAMSYDHSGTHIGDLAYTYDQAGRRTGQSGSLAALVIPGSVPSATYDAANRLTNWGGSALTYDANGNLNGIGSSSTFSWNARDQLVSTSDGGGVFTYDPLGRRSSLTVSGATTPYLYDGFNPATVGGNQILAGQGLDDFYAQTSSGSTTSYLSDALGSTVALTDTSGAVTGSYTYGAYGASSQSGTANTSFQYTGRENDGATNLDYYRERYYSPSLNRFVSQDPLGLGSGMNVYAYVRGNPVSRKDPMGLLDLFGYDSITAQGLSIQQLASSALQSLSAAFGISFEASTINPITSGGGGTYGLNLEHTACEGWKWYKYKTPPDSPSQGFLPGGSITVNFAMGTGSWTGPFDNVAGGYGTGILGVAAGGFQSVDDGSNSGYFGESLGVGAGPPGAGQTRTNYEYLFGPPKGCSCQ